MDERLTPARVRELTKDWLRDDAEPGSPAKFDARTPRYRTGEEWRDNVAAMKQNERIIYAMAIESVDLRRIAAALSVSRECIAKRLRPSGFLNPKGRRGPPRKEELAKRHVPLRREGIRLSCPEALLWLSGRSGKQ